MRKYTEEEKNQIDQLIDLYWQQSGQVRAFNRMIGKIRDYINFEEDAKQQTLAKLNRMGIKCDWLQRQ